jgi:hypothetical protein
MRITKSKIVAAVATTAVVALGGTAAFAYFTTTGSGGGNATVGSASNWGVTVDSVTGGPLFPGSGTEHVSYTVTNQSNGPVRLNLVTAAINSDGNGDVGAVNCKSAWFNISNLSGQAAGVLGAGGTNTGSFDITMTDTAAVQDACQNTAPGFAITAS